MVVSETSLNQNDQLCRCSKVEWQLLFTQEMPRKWRIRVLEIQVGEPSWSGHRSWVCTAAVVYANILSTLLPFTFCHVYSPAVHRRVMPPHQIHSLAYLFLDNLREPVESLYHPNRATQRRISLLERRIANLEAISEEKWNCLPGSRCSSGKFC